MKKLIYLIIAIAILGLIVPGCLPVVPPAEQNESVVSPNKVIGDPNEVWNSTTTTQYPTIQAAITDALPGETIIVGAGTYVESLGGWRDFEIFKSLNLVGAGSGQTVVQLTGLQHGLEIQGTDVNVLIEGITFTKKLGNDYSAGWAIIVGETGGSFNTLIFRDVEVAYAEARNVHLAAATYQNVLVEDCNVHHAGVWGFSARGIIINGMTVRNSIFEYNGIVDPSHGIGFDIDMPDNVQHLTIEGGSFSYNYLKGINLVKVNDVNLEGVTANENGEFGICLWEWMGTSSNIQIRDATLNNNGLDGILLGAETGKTIDNVTIIDSTISGNGRDGIMLYRATGWCEGQISNVSIHYSNIHDNTQFGVQVVLAYEDVDATYNWWGHPGGPRRPAGNSGKISGPKAADRVSENVLYHPWLSGADSVSNIALDQTATASATYLSFTANLAVDGDYSTLWNAGAHPTQWIEIDLGKGSTVVGLRLLTAQSSVGDTTHVVLFSNDGDVIADRTFSGITETEQWLEAWFDAPFHGVKTLRVTTTVSPSWVAWYEIEVYGWQ